MVADLPTPAEITALAGLLAPGLIILGVRSRFRDGNLPDFKDKIVAYGVASTAYYAGISPIFHVSRGIALPPAAWSFLFYFLVPVVVAAAVVVFDQSEWFYKLCSRLGIRLSHHIPAAWDFAFSRVIRGTYVLVRLNDGTLYAGKLANGSFASSSSTERDLYIEEVWNIDTAPWSVVMPRRGVLLCGKDIRWIEIFARD